MKRYDGFLSWMALFDHLETPRVTPGERLAILQAAQDVIHQHVQPPGVTELVDRMMTSLSIPATQEKTHGDDGKPHRPPKRPTRS